MVKYFCSWLRIFISIILLFTLMPVQANASQDDVSPKVISSSISEKIIAYKGIKNPGVTTIKFETDKPVVAYLQVSNNAVSTRVGLSKWLDKKSKYEFSFVPMNYEKAYYEQFESLPPGTYSVSVEITDASYNRSIIGLGTIEIVKENQEQPLVEVLDIKITNEVKAKKIAPKMSIKYKVNRPAYVEAPVFRDYINDFVGGERTQVGALPVKYHITNPGIYEVEWDLKPTRVLSRNGPPPLDVNNILQPYEYKLFFRSEEESIWDYASQPSFDELRNNEEIDFLITSNKNNTQIKILDGWAPQFVDIQGHWSKDNILFLSSKKIINGVGNNKFNPNSNITRAEYMTMIVKALNLNINPTDKSSFSDIQPNAWYNDTVEAALELGLITGQKDHTFRPNSPITRQEMAAIAVRALQYKTAQQSSTDINIADVLDIYKDKANISSWARNSVALATNYKLINGRANNVFDPNGISTRAEGAAVVKRLYDHINVSSN